MGAAQKLRSKLFACYASVRSTARPPDAAKFTLTRWSASIDSLPPRGRDAAGAHRRHRQPNETLMMLARSFTPPTFPKTTSQRKKTCDRLFLAQFRADRATAVSDIIVRVAADDLRQTQRQRPMGCRSMRGPRFSPYRASGEYRAECLGLFVVCLPSHHGGHMRGFGS